MSKGKKFALFCKKLLYFVMTIVVGGLFVGVFLNAEGFLGNNMVLWKYFLFVMGGMLILLLFMQFIFSMIDKYCFTNKRLIITSGVLALVMIAIFVVIMNMLDVMAMTDSATMIDTALLFADKPNRVMTAENAYSTYFGRYGNNFFTVVLFKNIFRLFNIKSTNSAYLLLRTINVVMVMLSTLMTYCVVYILKGLKAATKLMVLCVFNPIYYFLIFFLYTTILCLPLMIGVILFAILFAREKRYALELVYALLMVVCVVLGYFVRPVCVIPFIAIVGCGIVLWFIPSENKKYIAFKTLRGLLVCAVIGGVLYSSISKVNDHYFSEVKDSNFPATHWIMMSSHGNGIHTVEDVMYTASFATAEEKKAANIEKIKENYGSLGVKGIAMLWGTKLVLNWCSGISQADSRIQYPREHSVLWVYVCGDKNEWFTYYCDIYKAYMMLMILIVAIYYLINKKDTANSDNMSIFMLALFGAVAFYIIWEVQSVYSVPFLPIMFVLAEEGADICSKLFNSASAPSWVKKKLSIGKLSYLCVAVLIVCSYALSIGEVVYCNDNINIKYEDYTIKSTESYLKPVQMPNKGSVVIQQFYGDGVINRLGLRYMTGQSDEEALAGEYYLELISPDGAVIDNLTLTTDDVKKTSKAKDYVWKLDDIILEKGNPYAIRITRMNDSDNIIKFMVDNKYMLDTYEGELTVDGEGRKNDLYLKVYYEGNTVD